MILSSPNGVLRIKCPWHQIERKQTALEQKQLELERLTKEREEEREKERRKRAEVLPAGKAVREQQHRLDSAKTTAAAHARDLTDKVIRNNPNIWFLQRNEVSFGREFL